MDLVVRVRAAGDSSLTAVFRPLLAASAAASRGVEAQLAGAGKAAARGASEGVAAHKRAGKEVEGVYRKLGSAAEEWAKQSDKAQAATHKRALANLKELEREQKRSADAQIARSTTAARAERAATVASGALRTFGGLARTGLSTLGSAAMGFGVDFSLQSGLAKSVARDTLARNISAQAYRGRPGEVAESPAALDALAQSVGEKYKIDPGKALGGLGKFQALTGDLETGKAALDGLAKLAKGFGVDLDQMVGAAGQVSSALGDVGEGKAFATNAEKAAELNRIMRATTAQTQEGAIEMADFVSQFAKLKGAGIRFEGNVGDNILKMSALAQMAYQTGGAGSVSQASNAVMGFTNTLATKARRDAFKAQGVEIDSKELGKFVDPYEIIKRSLKATGGDTDKMKSMWGNILGEKAVNALSGAFRGAGGGDKGLAAVDALTARFGGTVTNAQLETNLATQMGSKASDAQAFQIELDKVTSQLGTELSPALKDLGPVAIGAAKGLSGLVSFGASHPETAITAAIVASIGKSMGGPAGATFQIAAATLVLGKMAIDSVSKDANEGETASLGGEARRGNAAVSGARALAGKKDAAVAGAEVMGAISDDIHRLRMVNKLNEGGVGDALMGTVPGLGALAGVLGIDKEVLAARDYTTGISRGMSVKEIGEARADAVKQPEIQADLAKQTEVLSQLGPKLGALTTAASDLAAAAKAFNGAGGSGPGPTPNEAARSGGVR